MLKLIDRMQHMAFFKNLIGYLDLLTMYNSAHYLILFNYIAAVIALNFKRDSYNHLMQTKVHEYNLFIPHLLNFASKMLKNLDCLQGTNYHKICQLINYNPEVNFEFILIVVHFIKLCSLSL